MIAASPQNKSGYGRGQYASPTQVSAYLKNMRVYLDRRRAQWLDRWQCRLTGEFPRGIRDLCTESELDDHLVLTAIRRGLLDPRSRPQDGIKARQVGMYSAICYFRDSAGRRFIAFEAARFLDLCELQQIDAIRRSEDQCSDVATVHSAR